MAAMRLYFLFLCGFLASVSCVRKLNSIDDLRNTGYGRPPPRHGLPLLYWFTQRVEVDQNNNIIPSNLYPSRQDSGFHYFGNRNNNGRNLLPSLYTRQSYHSVGNLHCYGANRLPYYVRRYYENTNVPERNMDRLIVSLDQNRPNRISRVFITAHNRYRMDFNRYDTYEIDPALIRVIQENYTASSFLQETQYYDNNNYCRNGRHKKRSTISRCNIQQINIEFKTTTQGNAKIKWDSISDDLIGDLLIIVCQRSWSCDYTKDLRIRITELYGSADTSIPLNAGLRLELLTIPEEGSPEISHSSEFDGAYGVIPKRIKGTDASLQLYVKGGKACALLYIKKTFTNWKDVFNNAWIGFYKSSRDKNEDYYTYQKANKFALIDITTDDYNIYQYMSSYYYKIYQYKSSLTMAPGVQIRLLQGRNYNSVLAQTVEWEGNELEKEVCDLQPDLSSLFYDPEFFNDEILSDANDALPIKIKYHDVGLQLFTQDFKTCARLFIKKTFTDWKETFKYSWVGFYTRPQDKDKGYEKYEYVVNFEKMAEGTRNFDVYQYKFELAIAPGVQLRFMGLENYYDKLGETTPWKGEYNTLETWNDELF